MIEKIMQTTKLSTKESQEFECEICKDYGYIWKLGQLPDQCGCVRRKITERYNKKSTDLFSAEYSGFTLKSFVAKEVFQKHMIKVANKYLYNKGIFSILYLGQSGAGKSHICIAIGNELIRRGAYVEFMPFVEFMLRVKQVMADNEAFNMSINKYRNCDYLIIDDFLKHSKKSGRTNETDIQIMFDILDFRYRKKRPVILSSEYLLSEIADMDEAITGRLKQMATHGDDNYVVEIGRDKTRNYRFAGGDGADAGDT